MKGERETYLPGSGYNEGSGNNGSGHGGFPLLMFVPCLLACSSPVLVSSRSLFVFLLSFSVFCVCFSSAFPWFSFCSRYLLCFSFFVCVCPFSLGLFFLFSLALTCSVFLCFFLFLALFWVDFSCAGMKMMAGLISDSFLPFSPSPWVFFFVFMLCFALFVSSLIFGSCFFQSPPPLRSLFYLAL
jgi:hypothetical protein